MSKVGPCKIIGIVSLILGLILIIISSIFLVQLKGCKYDYKHHIGPDFGFGKSNPGFGFGGNGFPHNNINKRPHRTSNDYLKSNKPTESFGYFNIDFTRFYACAICGIVFGSIQLLISGWYSICLSQKNCKKYSMIWCGFQVCLIIANIGVFIAVLTFKTAPYIKYGGKVEKECLDLKGGFLAALGFNFAILIICCICALWCSKKSDHDEEQHEEENVKFNKQ